MSPARTRDVDQRTCRREYTDVRRNDGAQRRPSGIQDPIGPTSSIASSLSVNMGETVTPWKFSVEGESGSESDERIGAGPRWAGDRGGGQSDAAAVLGGVQTEDRQGGRRL